MSLNADQRYAFDSIMRGDNGCLTGPAGTGKSYLISEIVQGWQKANKSYAISATTGTAALNLKLDGAQTFHSFLKLKTKTFSLADYVLQWGKFTPEVYDGIDAIIVEEVSMLTPEQFEMLYEIVNLHRFPNIVDEMHIIRDNNTGQVRQSLMTAVCEEYRRQLLNGTPGNVQFLLVGDFLQLPPIKEKGRKCILPDRPLFEMDYWNHGAFKVFELKIIQRQRDVQLQSAFNKIRYNVFDDDVIEILNTFSKNIERPDSIHLFSHAAEKDAHNKAKLALCRGRSITLSSKDILINPNDEHQSRRAGKEFRFEKELELKIGCKVMLLRNINQQLVNGSIGVVVELQPVTVDFNGVAQVIQERSEELFELTWSEKYKRCVKIEFASRKQLPLSLAYGMTIHKSQGMSLKSLVLHADKIFTPGQFYVGLSRGTDKDGIVLRNFNIQALQKVGVSKSVVKFYKNIRPSQRFEDFVEQIDEKILAAITLKQLQHEFPAIAGLKRYVLKRKNALNRIIHRSSQEESLLKAYEIILNGGVPLIKTDDIKKLFILCPQCDCRLDEYQLLHIGLLCECGCTAHDIMDQVIRKYGWACYIIQDDGLTLTDTVDYVGITERGGARLYEQKIRLRDQAKTIRCSLRLGETLLIQMLNPRDNIQRRGNHIDSYKARIGENVTTQDGTGTSLVDIKLCNRFSFIDGFNKTKMLHGISGILDNTRNFTRTPDWCMLKKYKVCKHKLPCTLQKYRNEMQGKLWHHPFDESEVRKHVEHDVFPKGSQVLDNMTLDDVIRVRTSRLRKNTSIESAKSSITNAWNCGLLGDSAIKGPICNWMYFALMQSFRNPDAAAKIVDSAKTFWNRLLPYDRQRLLGIGCENDLDNLTLFTLKSKYPSNWAWEV